MYFNQPKAKWLIVILVLLVCTLLARLGFWQLDRAKEKENLLKQPLLENTLIGNFLNEHYFLVDNITFKNKLGYEIIIPFKISKTSGSEIVFINRGFIERTLNRTVLPEIPLVSNTVSITGIAYTPEKNRWIKDTLESERWPRVIQQPNLDFMIQQLPYSNIQPKLFMLSADSPYAFHIIEKKRYTITPEKHRAYAFQWFALCITLGLLFICTRKKLIG